MLKKLNTKEKFYLLGYSFGVYIALEMAALLEKHGKWSNIAMLV